MRIFAGQLYLRTVGRHEPYRRRAGFDVSVDEGREPEISGYTFIPIVTHYDHNYSNIRLYKLSDYTAELASAHGVRANSRFDYDYIIEYLTDKGLYEAE